MSRSTNRSTRPLASRATLLVAAVAGTATLLTGCSAGQIAQTTAKVPSVPGVNVDLGDLRIRNALASSSPEGNWKAGSEVPLEIRVTNVGLTPDKLIRIESADAERVELRAGSAAPAPSATPSAGAVTPPDILCASPAAGDLAPSSPSASATPSTGATPSTSVTPSTSASPSGSATPSTTASVTPSTSASATPGQPIAPLPVQQVVINPGCLAILDDTTQQPVLVKANKDLLVGDLVTIKLTFERSGELTLTLPVAPPATPLPRVTVTFEDEEGHE